MISRGRPHSDLALLLPACTSVGVGTRIQLYNLELASAILVAIDVLNCSRDALCLACDLAGVVVVVVIVKYLLFDARESLCDASNPPLL